VKKGGTSSCPECGQGRGQEERRRVRTGKGHCRKKDPSGRTAEK